MSDVALRAPAEVVANAEFDELVSKADPNVQKHKELFNEIGKHCHLAEAAYSSLRGIIDVLRKDAVFLADEASFQVAKMYIWEHHVQAKSDTVDQYTRNLRALLRCPAENVPLLPSITGSLPHWQGVGDEVDCLLNVSRDGVSREITLEWWHCIILEAAACKSVLVYWVGSPPKEGTRRQQKGARCNPSTVLRKDLRSHRHDAYSGSDGRYNVVFIRQQYISQAHGSNPVSRVQGVAVEVGAEPLGSPKPKPSPAGKGNKSGEAKPNPPKPEPKKQPASPKPEPKKQPAPRPAGKGKPNVEPGLGLGV